MIRRLSFLCNLNVQSTSGRLLIRRGQASSAILANGRPTFSLARQQLRTDCASKKALNFKILNNDVIYPIESSSITGSDIELDDFELDIAGQKLVVNLTWLRDSCHCKQCTHQYSRQRLFTAKEFKRDMFGINEVQILNDIEPPDHVCWPSSDHPNIGYLNIKWADGHESYYSLGWLNYVSSLYNDTQLRLDMGQKRSRFLLPEDDFYSPSSNNASVSEYWCVSKINSNLKPIEYHDLIDGFKFHHEPTHINANKISEMSPKRFKAVLGLSRQLVTYGLAKIVNVPLERNQVLNVVKSLAYERPTGYGTVFDVVVEPSEEINLAYSSQEFDLHSDLTYRETSPGVQLLHCLTNSVDGGQSYFSDAFNAANILRQNDPNLFEVLVQFPVTFVVRDPYRNLKFRRQKPVLALDHQGKLEEVYYSPFMLPPIGFRGDVKLFYLAFDKFTKILQSKENKVIAKMEPGDLYIFHNRRVLHGRSSYDPSTSNRFLQGCYMDWDEINCLYEKLHSHR